MYLLVFLLGCGKPALISAEIAFETPEPGDSVCGGPLGAAFSVSSMLDAGADVVLLAFFDDLGEEGAWDPDSDMLVAGAYNIDEGESEVSFDGQVDWADIEGENTGRVLLVADVGAFGQLQEGDWMEAGEYEDSVSVADVFARASVSVRVCP